MITETPTTWTEELSHFFYTGGWFRPSETRVHILSPLWSTKPLSGWVHNFSNNSQAFVWTFQQVVFLFLVYVLNIKSSFCAEIHSNFIRSWSEASAVSLFSWNTELNERYRGGNHFLWRSSEFRPSDDYCRVMWYSCTTFCKYTMCVSHLCSRFMRTVQVVFSSQNRPERSFVVPADRWSHQQVPRTEPVSE